MLIGKSGNTTAARGTAEEPYLHKIGLVNVLKGNSLLTDGSGESIKTNGAAVIELDNSLQHTSVNVIKTETVDLQFTESIICDLTVDSTVTPHLREVTNSLQKTVGDSGSTARTGSDLDITDTMKSAKSEG